MKSIRLSFAVTTLCLMFSCRVPGQGRDSSKSECASLQNARPADLAQFLSVVAPDEKNGDCVAWAIEKLGQEHFEPAIPALLRLLDFHRPPTEREKKGIYMRMQGIWEIYPSTGALSQMGEKALPEILRAIEGDSTPPAARKNAVFVWMEYYRREGAQHKGVWLLKQKERKAVDQSVRQKLKWAVEKAVSWCNPEEAVACRQAAATDVP